MIAQKTIACPVCDANQFRPFCVKKHNQIVQCENCRLYYVNPVPVKNEFEDEVRESDLYTHDQLRKVAFFRRRADRLFDQLERQMPTGRLLDVGCAIGTQLMVGRERGWDCTGVELSQTSVAVARKNGLHVLSEPLDDLALPESSFDVVTLNHVLEHITDVEPFMSEIARVLRPGGLLYISLPNINQWQGWVYGKENAWGVHYEHYLFFSPRTLKRLLKKYHFTATETETHRWRDFHGPLANQSRKFRVFNRTIETLGLGIEILCLARLEK